MGSGKVHRASIASAPRPAAGSASAAPTALQRRLRAFLHALGRRYDRWRACWPGLELVLRQPLVTLRAWHQHSELLWAPRLQLTIVAQAGPHPRPAGFPTRAPAQEAPEAAAPTQPALPPAVAVYRYPGPLPEPRRQQRIEVVHAETIVRQLARRGERVEAALLPGTGRPEPVLAAGQQEAAAPLGAVPRVVLRPAGGPLATASGAPSPGPAGEGSTLLGGNGWPTRTRHAGPGGDPAPAPVDIAHLTEQVIQVLDRRIIAQRERLGRV